MLYEASREVLQYGILPVRYHTKVAFQREEKKDISKKHRELLPVNRNLNKALQISYISWKCVPDCRPFFSTMPV